MDKIAVVGLGYVGLPLCLQFSRSGVDVTGIDVDRRKVDAVNAGQSYIKHITAESIAEQIQGGHFRATDDFAVCDGVDAVIICVPTPLNKNREPDISYITDTGKAIAPHLHKGMLVCLESTTYPGTTDGELRAVLEQGSGLKAGTDFHLAFSPEREDPGNPHSVVASIPKVVGGYTPACLEAVTKLYSKAIHTLVPVSSCRAAEAAKITENTFRCVNIALVNELKQVYQAMGIDVWEVIAAAATKPFGFMAFYPGPGLGGHCIPIDPFYLTWKAREFGQYTKFIELAGEVNTAMPDWILMEKLEARGATVDYHDDYLPVIRETREHPHFAGRKSVPLDPATVRGYDCVLIATAHKDVDYAALAQSADLIVDTRNAMAAVPTKPGQVWKA